MIAGKLHKYYGSQMWFLMLIILTIRVSPLQSQTAETRTIKGRVNDQNNGQPIPFASVAVYGLPDTTLITGTITDAEGAFELRRLPGITLLLKAGFVGYRIAFQTLPSNESHPVNLALSTAAATLEGIEITATATGKQSSIEKTKISMEGNLSASTGNIGQVLASQPNITLDNDQNVYIRGNKNVLLLIDGIPTTIGSLQNIPASLVESIEIITNPDVRFDSEGTGGIINLTTRKSAGNETSAAITINMSNLQRMNGGLNLRLPGKKLSWNLGYNGSFVKDEIKSSLERVIPSASIRYEQAIETEKSEHLHAFNVGAVYAFRKKSQLSGDLRLSFPELSNQQLITGFRQHDSMAEPLTQRCNDFLYSRLAFEAKVMFTTPLKPRNGAITAIAGFSRTRGRRPASYYFNQQLQQKGEGGGYPTNATFQSDAWLKTGQSGRIETGIKFFSRWNSFSYNFYDRDTLSLQENWILNPIYSNDLSHSEHIVSAYAMYADTLVKSLYYKAGFRLEYNTSKLSQYTLQETISKDFLYPFPFLLANYSINQSQQISVALNRRITRPNYPQLNPFINFIDEMTFETGNKNLNPEILDKLEINYSIVKKNFGLKSGFYLEMRSNYLTQISLMPDPEKLILTWVNGDRQTKVGTETDINFQIRSLSTITLSMGGYYTSAGGTAKGINLDVSGFSWASTLKINLFPLRNTSLQITGTYRSDEELPQFSVESIYGVDLAVKQSLLNNQLTLSATITDAFDTRRWSVKTDKGLYTIVNHSKNNSRLLWFGITFSINSHKPSKPDSEVNKDQNPGLIQIGQ